MDLDLKKCALDALETAKKDLARDGYLIPIALVVTNAGILDFTLEFEGEEQKTSAYSRLIETAREKCGTAVITVNDAYCSEHNSLEGYYQGKLQNEDAPECIYVTVSGPAITTWSMSVPYRRNGNEFVFGTPIETFNDSLNLLPGWASGEQSAS